MSTRAEIVRYRANTEAVFVGPWAEKLWARKTAQECTDEKVEDNTKIYTSLHSNLGRLAVQSMGFTP